jgi:yecA family protein
MQAVSPPNLDELSSALQRLRTDCSGSELHGVMTGLLAGGARLNRQALIKALESHSEADQAFDNEIIASLWQLQLQTLEDLQASELIFTPLLPDDDAALNARVQALADWCQGFLVGFGTAVRPNDARLHEESVKETLQDVVHVANVDPTAQENDDGDEGAYAELFEFVRMAAIHLFEEMAPAEEPHGDADGDKHPKPTLH